MDEAEFWRRLERRICSEFACSPDRQFRFVWCDGLVPEERDLAGGQGEIRGLAWCGPTGQERWRFTLAVGRDSVTGGDTDWEALLPDDQLTGWLAADPGRRTLRIDPSAGHAGS